MTIIMDMDKTRIEENLATLHLSPQEVFDDQEQQEDEDQHEEDEEDKRSGEERGWRRFTVRVFE
ncbi:hypothetical protein KI387_042321, partial [Taxus chinensis]